MGNILTELSLVLKPYINRGQIILDRCKCVDGFRRICDRSMALEVDIAPKSRVGEIREAGQWSPRDIIGFKSCFKQTP